LFWIHLRLTFRQLLKEKLYPSINVLGLALGLCCFTVLATILRSELAYDRYHDNHAEIYRVISRIPFMNFALTPESLGPLLLQDFPQLGEYVRFQKATQEFLQTDQRSAFWDRMYLADDNVFDVFTHDVVSGDIETAFDNPFSIAISKPMSEFYFGDSDPIGQVLSTGTLDYTVSLVFELLPGNTHFQYDALIPFKMLLSINPNRVDTYIDNLGWVTAYTYLRFPSMFDVREFESISNTFLEVYMAKEGGASNNSLELQPLTSIHYGEKLNGDQPTGNIFYLYGYSAAALLVLVVAIFNYVALSTARSIRRCREIQTRRILGSSKRQLATQYLGESVSISIAAALIGLVLAELVLSVAPLSSSLSIGNLVDTYFGIEYLGLFLVFGVLTGLFAGAYPAFYMARMPVSNSLSIGKKGAGKSINLAKILLFSQITTSVIVIGAAFAIQDQLQFLLNKPLGFDRNNRVILEVQGADAIEGIPVIRDELIASGDISDLSFTSLPPGTDRGASSNFPVENEDGLMVRTQFNRVYVGEHYINTMGIEVIQGIDFSSDSVSNILDTVMVNQTMVKQMGWSDPVGKEIQMLDDGSIRRVIGVTTYFNYDSLHNTIGPMVLQPISPDFTSARESARPRFRLNIVVSLRGSNTEESLVAIERAIKQFDPDYILEPQFLDSSLSQLYSSEIRLKNLIGAFAFVAMLISMMGVFGQAALASERRRKELAIRKVLGAIWIQIIVLLCRQFLPIVVASSILASIFGVYVISLWASNFAYHEQVTILPFFASAVLVGLVASVTISLQSMRTSLMNPVDSLRFE